MELLFLKWSGWLLKGGVDNYLLLVCWSHFVLRLWLARTHAVWFLRGGRSVIVAMLLVDTSYRSLIILLLMVWVSFHVALLSYVGSRLVMSKAVVWLIRPLFVVIRLMLSRWRPSSLVVWIAAFLIVRFVIWMLFDYWLVWPLMVIICVSAVVRPWMLKFGAAISVIRALLVLWGG